MREKRFHERVPTELGVNLVQGDGMTRARTEDLTANGLFVHLVRPAGPLYSQAEARVAVELVLPGESDSIWAAGEICYEQADAMTIGRGIRFSAIAGWHARRLHDFCGRLRRERLSALLRRVA